MEEIKILDSNNFKIVKVKSGITISEPLKYLTRTDT